VEVLAVWVHVVGRAHGYHPMMAEPMDTTRRVLSPELAGELRGERLATGLGLRAAARRIKTDHAYLHALEAGKRCPSVAMVEAIVAAGYVGADLASRLRSAGLPDVGRSNRWHTRQGEETWSYEH